MRVLKIARLYKHFKGNKYVTVGISKPVANLLVKPGQELLSVWHTELEINIAVDGIGNTYYHDSSIEKGILVLYKQVSLDPKIYAREIKMFLSEADPERSKQKYRFEEVK